MCVSEHPKIMGEHWLTIVSLCLRPNAKLYTPQQTTLALKEKVFSLSGDDFTIKTAQGTAICQCKGKMISLRDRKKFTDMQGNELFTLSNKMMSIHKSFRGETPDGKADFEIKGKFKLMGSRSVITFRNAADGREIELEIKGDWFDRSAEISWEGRPIAAISRKFFNAREWFGDKQTVSRSISWGILIQRTASLECSAKLIRRIVLRHCCRQRGSQSHRGDLHFAGREGEREVIGRS